MSQTNFICPSSCLDFFVCPNGTKFACCKDGIYALTSTENNDSLDFDEADDDIFAEPKKPCLVPSVSKDIDGVLRVKFKREALCFTVLDKIIFSLHLHRNGNQAYIEATCLETFQCKNPNMCLLTNNGAERDSVCWMLTSEDGKIVVHCFGITYIGKFRSPGLVDDGLEIQKCSAKNRLELYAKNILQRPKIVSADIIERIVDEFKYQKSGRIVWKTEIPILHVSRVRSQGCATSSATGFYVMTNYGTIYSLCLPYNCSSSPIPTGTQVSSIESILQRSEELHFFNKKKDSLNNFLDQLQLALNGNSDLVSLTNTSEDLEIDTQKQIVILTIQVNQILHGCYWNLAVSFRGGTNWKIFSLPMKVLSKDTKWKLRVPIDFEICLHDLPITVTSKLIFKSNKDDLKLDLDPWLHTELTSLNFLRIKSSLVSSNESDDKDKLLVEDDLNQASFEDFLQKLNNQRVLSDVTSCKDLKSVIVNVASTDSIKFLSDLKETTTLYVDLFGALLSLSVENQCKINIRGRNLEAMLKLKQDMLTQSSKEKGTSQKSLRNIISIIETIADGDEKDRRLDYCYKHLRNNNSVD